MSAYACTLRLCFVTFLAIAKTGVKALVPAKDGRRYGFVINSFFDLDVFDLEYGTLNFSPVAL